MASIGSQALTGIEIETSDISLASRILANFPEKLTNTQRIPDNLAGLGKLNTVSGDPMSSR